MGTPATAPYAPSEPGELDGGFTTPEATACVVSTSTAMEPSASCGEASTCTVTWGPCGLKNVLGSMVTETTGLSTAQLPALHSSPLAHAGLQLPEAATQMPNSAPSSTQLTPARQSELCVQRP